MEYILALQNASFDDPVSSLDDQVLQRICNPRNSPVEIEASEICHTITAYLGCEHAAQNVYEIFRHSHNTNFPQHGCMHFFCEVERFVDEYTGVEKFQHDMCPNTCIGYTGPFQDLKACPKCNTSHWNQEKLIASNGRTKVSARKFTTIPLAPSSRYDTATLRVQKI